MIPQYLQSVFNSNPNSIRTCFHENTQMNQIGKFSEKFFEQNFNESFLSQKDCATIQQYIASLSDDVHLDQRNQLSFLIFRMVAILRNNTVPGLSGKIQFLKERKAFEERIFQTLTEDLNKATQQLKKYQNLLIETEKNFQEVTKHTSESCSYSKPGCISHNSVQYKSALVEIKKMHTPVVVILQQKIQSNHKIIKSIKSVQLLSSVTLLGIHKEISKAQKKSQEITGDLNLHQSKIKQEPAKESKKLFDVATPHLMPKEKELYLELCTETLKILSYHYANKKIDELIQDSLQHYGIKSRNSSLKSLTEEGKLFFLSLRETYVSQKVNHFKQKNKDQLDFNLFKLLQGCYIIFSDEIIVKPRYFKNSGNLVTKKTDSSKIRVRLKKKVELMNEKNKLRELENKFYTKLENIGITDKCEQSAYAYAILFSAAKNLEIEENTIEMKENTIEPTNKAYKSTQKKTGKKKPSSKQKTRPNPSHKKHKKHKNTLIHNRELIEQSGNKLLLALEKSMHNEKLKEDNMPEEQPSDETNQIQDKQATKPLSQQLNSKNKAKETERVEVLFHNRVRRWGQVTPKLIRQNQEKFPEYFQKHNSQLIREIRLHNLLYMRDFFEQSHFAKYFHPYSFQKNNKSCQGHEAVATMQIINKDKVKGQQKIGCIRSGETLLDSEKNITQIGIFHLYFHQRFNDDNTSIKRTLNHQRKVKEQIAKLKKNEVVKNYKRQISGSSFQQNTHRFWYKEIPSRKKMIFQINDTLFAVYQS